MFSRKLLYCLLAAVVFAGAAFYLLPVATELPAPKKAPEPVQQRAQAESPPEVRAVRARMASLELSIKKERPLGLMDGIRNFTEYFGLAQEQPFQGEVACRFTFALFKNLQRRFDDAEDLEAHYDLVGAYLAQTMAPAEASEMFEIYQKLTDYELQRETMEAQVRSRIVLDGAFDRLEPDEKQLEYAVRYVHARQEVRREMLGQELADAIFGQEVKRDEYALRKGFVIRHGELYGSEKEALLDEVREHVYGIEKEAAATPFALKAYREKLALYERDLKEASPEERRQMIDRFRRETAPPGALRGIQDLEHVRRSNQ
jgi:hypothetical protein